MNLIPRSFLFDNFFDNIDDKFRICYMKSDIYEIDNNYIIEIDIPGYSKDNIDIDIERGYLTISVSMSDDVSSDEKKYIRKERVYGTTKRQFYVGNVNEDEIKANFNDGVLKVIVPRKEELSVKKKIEIE